MKLFLRILILLQFSIMFTGCSNYDISPILYKDEKNIDELAKTSEVAQLNYTIDNITLSKSYQSTEPNIKIIKSGLDSNLLLSLGIVESSGIHIEKIEKKDRDVNIHIVNENTYDKKDFVVPQIILHFDDLSLKELENFNFKIVNENYKPIKSNIDISEAISKVKSSLKINTSTFPDSNIIKRNDDIFLDLSFTNVADLKDKENPIINLNVIMDLINGKIVEFSKSPVSSLIDEGEILEYVTDKYIFYVKKVVKNKSSVYDLWMYDINKDKREKIFSSKNKFTSLKISDSEDKALLLSCSGKYNNLYTFELKDLKVNRIDLSDKINPSIPIWRNDDIIFAKINKSNTQVYSFNTKENKLLFLSQVDKNISEIKYSHNKFLYTVKSDDIKKIYLTEDFKEIDLIDSGEKGLFLDDQTICYMKKQNNNDKNVLWFYNIKDKSVKSYTDLNVKDFFIWKDNLAIIEKSQIESNNPLYIYNLKDEISNFVTTVKTDKIFLNTEKNILYINSSVDIKDYDISVISFIEL